ncbi:MAG: SAM-dependent methyltransferase, partial [Acetivibrionales bacterium]
MPRIRGFMRLPEFFEENFRALMDKNEYRDFIASFGRERNFGIRVNTLKIKPDEFLDFIERQLEPIPWISEGFYYPEGEVFGKHPAYHAGLYYIQEPSAMMPAQALCPEPGEKVLDLCAAPGGKTTALGSRMQNMGLLVANDISPKRVKALVKNVELMGLTNTFIVNESPEKLQQVYPAYFDRILLDVPCSGEGMFRKDKEAVQSYSRFKSDECVRVQREI